jgi:hypothetical protein
MRELLIALAVGVLAVLYVANTDETEPPRVETHRTPDEAALVPGY